MLSNFYNIDGFTDNLMENKTFMDGLERYKIEHPLPQVSPAIQMSYALLSTIFITHQLNSVSENQLKKYTMKPPEMSSELKKELDILDENDSEKIVETKVSTAQIGDKL